VTDWNFADLVEAVAATVPDGPAVIEADGAVVTWREVDRRADRLAAAMVQAGLPRQSMVAVFMRNSSAFLEAYYASFKAALAPVNINYRYGVDETAQLLADSGAAAVVYHAQFRDVIAAVHADREQRGSGGVRIWIEVPDGSEGAAPEWAADYRELIAGTGERVEVPRSGDDVVVLYTGGTTGLPKGVVWRQSDLFRVLVAPGNPFRGIPVPESIDQLMGAIRRPGPVDMAACPYMHATGLFNQLMTMIAGGTSVVVPGSSFDPVTLLDTAERHAVSLMVIVGDAMARPIAEALAESGRTWDLSALRTIVSSGATFSRAVKELLLDRLPHIQILDAFGSSEASGMGATVSRAGEIAETAQFRLGPNARLLRPDGSFVERGTPGEGLVALSGTLPLGYHNDPVKTAATFRVIDGVRYSIPGDLARVDADGSLHLLGRGSSCINSGGEKIYPEEVEEVVRRHPSVADAACIGVPDPRFGQAVAAVVELRAGATLELEELRAFVKQHLAGYKAPRHLVPVTRFVRSPSGKLDHRWLRDVAAATV
jgi:acyl-CoA synthetase (AMP-forming)/AMP-acid ligase II